MRRLLAAVALTVVATFADVTLPPVDARVGIVCNKFVGTDPANNLWVQWSKCGGLEANNYMQRVRGKFCTWFDSDCVTFSGPFVHVDWAWSKLNVDAGKWQRKGVWSQICPETGCL